MSEQDRVKPDANVELIFKRTADRPTIRELLQEAINEGRLYRSNRVTKVKLLDAAVFDKKYKSGPSLIIEVDKDSNAHGLSLSTQDDSIERQELSWGPLGYLQTYRAMSKSPDADFAYRDFLDIVSQKDSKIKIRNIIFNFLCKKTDVIKDGAIVKDSLRIQKTKTESENFTDIYIYLNIFEASGPETVFKLLASLSSDFASTYACTEHTSTEGDYMKTLNVIKNVNCSVQHKLSGENSWTELSPTAPQLQTIEDNPKILFVSEFNLAKKKAPDSVKTSLAESPSSYIDLVAAGFFEEGSKLAEIVDFYRKTSSGAVYRSPENINRTPDIKISFYNENDDFTYRTLGNDVSLNKPIIKLLSLEFNTKTDNLELSHIGIFFSSANLDFSTLSPISYIDDRYSEEDRTTTKSYSLRKQDFVKVYQRVTSSSINTLFDRSSIVESIKAKLTTKASKDAVGNSAFRYILPNFKVCNYTENILYIPTAEEQNKGVKKCEILVPTTLKKGSTAKNNADTIKTFARDFSKYVEKNNFGRVIELSVNFKTESVYRDLYLSTSSIDENYTFHAVVKDPSEGLIAQRDFKVPELTTISSADSVKTPLVVSLLFKEGEGDSPYVFDVTIFTDCVNNQNALFSEAATKELSEALPSVLSFTLDSIKQYVSYVYVKTAEQLNAVRAVLREHPKCGLAGIDISKRGRASKSKHVHLLFENETTEFDWSRCLDKLGWLDTNFISKDDFKGLTISVAPTHITESPANISLDSLNTPVEFEAAVKILKDSSEEEVSTDPKVKEIKSIDDATKSFSDSILSAERSIDDYITELNYPFFITKIALKPKGVADCEIVRDAPFNFKGLYINSDQSLEYLILALDQLSMLAAMSNAVFFTLDLTDASFSKSLIESRSLSSQRTTANTTIERSQSGRSCTIKVKNGFLDVFLNPTRFQIAYFDLLARNLGIEKSAADAIPTSNQTTFIAKLKANPLGFVKNFVPENWSVSVGTTQLAALSRSSRRKKAEVIDETHRFYKGFGKLSSEAQSFTFPVRIEKIQVCENEEGSIIITQQDPSETNGVLVESPAQLLSLLFRMQILCVGLKGTVKSFVLDLSSKPQTAIDYKDEYINSESFTSNVSFEESSGTLSLTIKESDFQFLWSFALIRDRFIQYGISTYIDSFDSQKLHKDFELSTTIRLQTDLDIEAAINSDEPDDTPELEDETAIDNNSTENIPVSPSVQVIVEATQQAAAVEIPESGAVVDAVNDAIEAETSMIYRDPKYVDLCALTADDNNCQVYVNTAKHSFDSIGEYENSEAILQELKNSVIAKLNRCFPTSAQGVKINNARAELSLSDIEEIKGRLRNILFEENISHLDLVPTKSADSKDELLALLDKDLKTEEDLSRSKSLLVTAIKEHPTDKTRLTDKVLNAQITFLESNSEFYDTCDELEDSEGSKKDKKQLAESAREIQKGIVDTYSSSLIDETLKAMDERISELESQFNLNKKPKEKAATPKVATETPPIAVVQTVTPAPTTEETSGYTRDSAIEVFDALKATPTPQTVLSIQPTVIETARAVAEVVAETVEKEVAGSGSEIEESVTDLRKIVCTELLTFAGELSCLKDIVSGLFIEELEKVLPSTLSDIKDVFTKEDKSVSIHEESLDSDTKLICLYIDGDQLEYISLSPEYISKLTINSNDKRIANIDEEQYEALKKIADKFNKNVESIKVGLQTRLWEAISSCNLGLLRKDMVAELFTKKFIEPVHHQRLKAVFEAAFPRKSEEAPSLFEDTEPIVRALDSDATAEVVHNTLSEPYQQSTAIEQAAAETLLGADLYTVLLDLISRRLYFSRNEIFSVFKDDTKNWSLDFGKTSDTKNAVHIKINGKTPYTLVFKPTEELLVDGPRTIEDDLAKAILTAKTAFKKCVVDAVAYFKDSESIKDFNLFDISEDRFEQDGFLRKSLKDAYDAANKVQDLDKEIKDASLIDVGALNYNNLLDSLEVQSVRTIQRVVTAPEKAHLKKTVFLNVTEGTFNILFEYTPDASGLDTSLDYKIKNRCIEEFHEDSDSEIFGSIEQLSGDKSSKIEFFTEIREVSEILLKYSRVDDVLEIIEMYRKACRARDRIFRRPERLSLRSDFAELVGELASQLYRVKQAESYINLYGSALKDSSNINAAVNIHKSKILFILGKILDGNIENRQFVLNILKSKSIIESAIKKFNVNLDKILAHVAYTTGRKTHLVTLDPSYAETLLAAKKDSIQRDYRKALVKANDLWDFYERSEGSFEDELDFQFSNIGRKLESIKSLPQDLETQQTITEELNSIFGIIEQLTPRSEGELTTEHETVDKLEDVFGDNSTEVVAATKEVLIEESTCDEIRDFIVSQIERCKIDIFEALEKALLKYTVTQDYRVFRSKDYSSFYTFTIQQLTPRGFSIGESSVTLNLSFNPFRGAKIMYIPEKHRSRAPEDLVTVISQSINAFNNLVQAPTTELRDSKRMSHFTCESLLSVDPVLKAAFESAYESVKQARLKPILEERTQAKAREEEDLTSLKAEVLSVFNELKAACARIKSKDKKSEVDASIRGFNLQVVKQQIKKDALERLKANLEAKLKEVNDLLIEESIPQDEVDLLDLLNKQIGRLQEADAYIAIARRQASVTITSEDINQFVSAVRALLTQLKTYRGVLQSDDMGRKTGLMNKKEQVSTNILTNIARIDEFLKILAEQSGVRTTLLDAEIQRVTETQLDVETAKRNKIDALKKLFNDTVAEIKDFFNSSGYDDENENEVKLYDTLNAKLRDLEDTKSEVKRLDYSSKPKTVNSLDAKVRRLVDAVRKAKDKITEKEDDVSQAAELEPDEFTEDASDTVDSSTQAEAARKAEAEVARQAAAEAARQAAAERQVAAERQAAAEAKAAAERQAAADKAAADKAAADKAAADKAAADKAATDKAAADKAAADKAAADTLRETLNGQILLTITLIEGLLNSANGVSDRSLDTLKKTLEKHLKTLTDVKKDIDTYTTAQLQTKLDTVVKLYPDAKAKSDEALINEAIAKTKTPGSVLDYVQLTQDPDTGRLDVPNNANDFIKAAVDTINDAIFANLLILDSCEFNISVSNSNNTTTYDMLWDDSAQKAKYNITLGIEPKNTTVNIARCEHIAEMFAVSIEQFLYDYTSNEELPDVYEIYDSFYYKIRSIQLP